MTATISAPPDLLLEFMKCQQSPVYFIKHYVKIQHPEHGTIPFDLWPWQAALLRRFQHDKHIILLKSRQIGVSELMEAYGVWLDRFHFSKKVLVISKNEDAATELMQRATFAHDHLPPWLQAGLNAIDGCQLGKCNTTLLEFIHHDQQGVTHPSSMQSVAATKSAGRSKSVSCLLLDAWAFQQFDKEIWTGIKATVEHGQLIGASTANGIGGVFHCTWVKAVAGQNTFTPIFLSWRRPPERDAAWYAREGQDNEPWQLHQEYPSEPTEAFIQSGRPVFDYHYLQEHGKRIAVSPPPISEDTGLTIWDAPQGEVKDAQGTITEKAHRYIIAADVAEGIGDGDYDAAVVVDRQTWRQVAELYGRWPLEVYAAKLRELATYYNTALLAVERNNHGHAVLLALKGYANLYHTTDELSPGNEQQKKPGWETTSKTKPMMVGDLARGLREGNYQPRSQAFLDEALIFAYQDNGSMSAPSGYHDDRVMSHAIAVHLLALPDPSQAALAYMSQWRSLTEERRATTPPEHPVRTT
jgi:hypothetical protein